MIDAQRAVCKRYGVTWVPAPQELKVGMASNVRTRLYPLNGLRHTPEVDTTGWYIWAGQGPIPVDDDHFFEPIHVLHLADVCPVVLPYLGLPPGWRFLLAEDYEDVWKDETLLDM
jgi:hypothetical protein